MKAVAAMLKAIHAQEDKAAARKKVRDVADKLNDMKLGKASALIEKSIE